MIFKLAVLFAALVSGAAQATDIRGSQPVMVWDEYSGNYVQVTQRSGINELQTAPRGSVQTSAPSAGANASAKFFTLDAFGRLSSLAALNVEWGQMFSTTTNAQALTGTGEVAFFLFRNPVGSGKNAKILRASVGTVEVDKSFCTYRFYRDATVTSNGTALTAVGNRDTGQASAVATPFVIPTVSSNGSLFRTEVLAGSSGLPVPIEYAFSLWVEPNHNILVTRQITAVGTIAGVNFEWAEQ